MGGHDKSRSQHYGERRSPSPDGGRDRHHFDDDSGSRHAKGRHHHHERRRSVERSGDEYERFGDYEAYDSEIERAMREKLDLEKRELYLRETNERGFDEEEERYGRQHGYGGPSRPEHQSYGYGGLPYPTQSTEFGRAHEGGENYGYPPPQGSASQYSGTSYAQTAPYPTDYESTPPPAPNYASQPFQGYPPPPGRSPHLPPPASNYASQPFQGYPPFRGGSPHFPPPGQYGNPPEPQYPADDYVPTDPSSGSQRPPASYGEYGQYGENAASAAGVYPQTAHQAPSAAYSHPAAYNYADPSASASYRPQHYSSAQAPSSQGEAVTPQATIKEPTAIPKPQAKPGVLESIGEGLSSAFFSAARTIFPATSTHKPLKPGESGMPDKVTGNRFESFADVRGWNRTKWYVDGKDYMYAVSVALERAEKSIWILDWWLTPELYLRRPPKDNENYRLDRMLKAAAERGVKINIIVYKEVPQALTLASVHTKHALEALHSNIAVFRHPDHLPDRKTIAQDIFKTFSPEKAEDGLKGLYGMNDGLVLFWAHHEKLCLVDGKLAFMGGLDLCFGRWDMNHHPISDVHPENLDQIVFPGQDYNNARVMDFHDVEQYDQNKLSRTSNSRMGWSDVALSVVGEVVEDLVIHFTERWNFIYREKYTVRKDIRYSLLDESVLKHAGHNLQGEQSHQDGNIDDPIEGNTGRLGGVECQIVRSCSKWSHGTDTTEHSIANAYIELITCAKHFIYIENQFFITATEDAQNPIINKIGHAIAQRVIRADKNGEKFRIIVNIPSVPAFAGDLKAEGSLGTRAIMEFQYRSICRDRGYSIMETIARAGVDPKKYIRFYNLRSYDRINFSGALAAGEGTSGVSYEAAATDFSQKVGGGQRTMEVRGDEYAKYQQAVPKTKTAWDSIASCAMLGGGDITKVPWHGDPDKEIDYIVSEELYIHTKLMIVDDRYVICGSANLNDRSQLGDHDSEIAIVIEDPTLLPTKMDGQDYEASHFAATLRRQLFRKHLGLIPAQNLVNVDENMLPVPAPNIYDFDSPADRLVADPLSDEFWNYWNATARTNTEVYRKVFRPVPDDTVTNWKLYDEFFGKHFSEEREGLFEEKQPPEKWGHVVRSDFSPGAQGAYEVKQLLRKVRGNLVEMPLEFLREEDIAKEGVALNPLTETIYT